MAKNKNWAKKSISLEFPCQINFSTFETKCKALMFMISINLHFMQFLCLFMLFLFIFLFKLEKAFFAYLSYIFQLLEVWYAIGGCCMSLVYLIWLKQKEVGSSRHWEMEGGRESFYCILNHCS